MGPFAKAWVRLAARFFLSRAAALVARGPTTAKPVRELLPGRKVHELPDVAFALEPAPVEDVNRALASAGLGRDAV